MCDSRGDDTRRDDHDAELAKFPVRIPAASGPARSLGRTEVLRARLEVLKRDHRQLDQAVTAMTAEAGHCVLALQRLKRQKLVLKDQIARIEDELTPDIIA